MESSVLDEQGFIQTTSHILWIMQLARDISKNDEQHIQRTTPWESVSELHGQLCHTNQDKRGIRRKDNLISEGSRKTQFMF